MNKQENINIAFYDENAEQLSAQYNSVSFEAVHPRLVDMLKSARHALDVGCGSGRDALAMAQRGLRVVAVDPSEAMLCHAAKQADGQVTFLKDSLPTLSVVKAASETFDLILLSAVWMHVEPELREEAFASLVQLLSDGGKIVILLRHGDFHDGRLMHPVSFAELETLACQHGLRAILRSGEQADVLHRADVWWQLVEIRL